MKVGSIEETLALRAFQQRNLSEYYKVVTVVNTIIYGFGALISSMNGGQAESPEKINDLLTTLRTLLLPDTEKDTENKAKKVKDIMERELSNGPFKVEAMTYKKRGKGLN